MLIPKDEQHVNQYCLVRRPIKRTGHNETKDRVGPSSSSLISNKMASSDAFSAVSDAVELLLFSKIQLVVYYQCCVLIG